jgi:hypothetical protein
MPSHNRQQLSAHILPLSVANDFAGACREWRLVDIELSDDWGSCPCGQSIKEHCYIQNRVNGHTTWVGNVCIRRFMQIDTGNLFSGLRRIAANDTASPNIDVIGYAHRRGYLYGDNEYRFLSDTLRKRNLTPKQLAWRQKINRRILRQIVVKSRNEVPQTVPLGQ